MKVVTAEQMRRIDRITIEERGIAGARLMERAGLAVVDKICELTEPCATAIVAGKGNNAGDGFVVARHLAQRRWPVTVFLLADPAELRGDARTMYEALPPEITQVRIEAADRLRDALKDLDLIVDSILGTGIQGPVGGLFGEAIRAINEAGRPVVSVDIPSGLPTDGGPIEGPVVRASHTVTMGLPKLGMLIHPGIEYTGNVSVASLDFPDDLLNDPAIKVILLTEAMIKRLLPERPRDGHKGTFGSVLVVGGSPGMTGALVLASRAAMRSGVGLVFCATAKNLQPQVAARLVEELTIALPSQDGLHLDLESLRSLGGQAKRFRAIGLGPGLGVAKCTEQFVRKSVEEIALPMVIDADGLNALAGHLDVFHGRTTPTILTPHPGEMSRLTGLTVAQIQSDRIGAARKLSQEFRVITVLKGAQTTVADPDGSAYINPTGNTGLAKGGSGDVLTGLMAGLLAQGIPALSASLCAVFLHGLAADLAADSIPPRAMIASDVIDHLPRAFQKVTLA